MSIVGIIPAAGRGERLGADRPKAFVACAGRPLINWSLDVLRAACDRVVVATPPDTDVPLDRSVERVSGGAARSQSVRAALAAAPEASIAVVHDAARPLVTVDLVERCLAALAGGFDAAIAAARMTDTIKRAAPDGRVEETLDRTRLWSAQTPQVFRAVALRDALAVDPATLARATDDAWLVERAGGRVRVVEAPADNLKVTTRADLEVAAALLRARRS